MNELELVKPELSIDLDIKLPEIPPIQHNLGIIEEWVDKLDKFYDKLVFNDEQYKEATAERTKVNKLLKEIADNRKENVKKYKLPIDDFEATSKRIEKALGEVASKLGQKIEVFELKEKKIKEEKINKRIEEIRVEFIESYKEYANQLGSLPIVFDNRWFNKTYKDKDLDEDIRTQFNEKVDDLDAFKKDAETIVNYFNAIDVEHKLNKEKYIERYKYTRDVNLVMNDIKTDYENTKVVSGNVEVFKEAAVVEEVDPFAGLSVNTPALKWVGFKVHIREDKVELFKQFAKQHEIDVWDLDD